MRSFPLKRDVVGFGIQSYVYCSFEMFSRCFFANIELIITLRSNVECHDLISACNRQFVYELLNLIIVFTVYIVN